MTLHPDIVVVTPELEQEFVRCFACDKARWKKPPGMKVEFALCGFCKGRVSCARCGNTRLARNLAKHQAGIACTERAVEHVLRIHGWHRTDTLSRSLRKRGFMVRYVPRWVVVGQDLLSTPVSHHPELWRQPKAPVPEPPPWPEEADLAIESLRALAAMVTLRGDYL
jgi:hypothetical protein